jgi:hypothetical protein
VPGLILSPKPIGVSVPCPDFAPRPEVAFGKTFEKGFEDIGSNCHARIYASPQARLYLIFECHLGVNFGIHGTLIPAYVYSTREGESRAGGIWPRSLPRYARCGSLANLMATGCGFTPAPACQRLVQAEH